MKKSRSPWPCRPPGSEREGCGCPHLVCHKRGEREAECEPSCSACVPGTGTVPRVCQSDRGSPHNDSKVRGRPRGPADSRARGGPSGGRGYDANRTDGRSALIAAPLFCSSLTSRQPTPRRTRLAARTGTSPGRGSAKALSRRCQGEQVAFARIPCAARAPGWPRQPRRARCCCCYRRHWHSVGSS